MIGLRIVRTGERVAIWNRRGEVRHVDGPRRLWLWRERVEPLTRRTAKPGEYLAIRYIDGRVEHVAGPAMVWFDPVVHAAIDTREALSISGHEAVVVYRDDRDSVERRVVEGPAVFVPAPNEWLHTFSWHGADPKAPHRKIPEALKFTKLRVIADQMYLDITEVRTADDALLCVKLMIFFELTDVAKMLDTTHDPIADFINAATADVIDFAGSRPFEQFKDETEKLNALATYPRLATRAELIGYRIANVVYRGYHASDKLQSMHDAAIEARTKLTLDSETELQAQELADLRLARERTRAASRQAMELEEVEHKNALERLTHDERFRQHERDREAELAQLGALHGMGVELTPYLVAQQQHPDRLIRVEGTNAPQLHLHEN